MSVTHDDIIARRAFDLLWKELPPEEFCLKDHYSVKGKVALHQKNSAPSVVLVWKSNDKERELTTRKEYEGVFNRWFPGFKREGERDYYSQILQSAEELLCKIKDNRKKIAKDILRVAGVGGVR